MSLFVRFNMGAGTDNLRPPPAKTANNAKTAQKQRDYAPQDTSTFLATPAKTAKIKSDGLKSLAVCAGVAQIGENSKSLSAQEKSASLAVLATLAGPPGEKRKFAGLDDENTAIVISWRSLIGGLSVPDHPTGLHIGTIALHFLSSTHIIKAIKLGWDERELFGLLDSEHPIAPLRRFDAMGLVPSLALSRLGARLVALEVDRAILKTRSGSRLVYPKRMTGRSISIPLWKHPLLCGDKACRPDKSLLG